MDIESFIEKNRKVCWESAFEDGELCVGVNKVRQFFDECNSPKAESENPTPNTQMDAILLDLWRALGCKGVIKSDRDEAIVEKWMEEHGVKSPFKKAKQQKGIKCTLVYAGAGERPSGPDGIIQYAERRNSKHIKRNITLHIKENMCHEPDKNLLKKQIKY
ncbi:MAG: hypothetical protein KC517_09115 [Bacteroidetes bacterium]|nr:hypothetical protein [Bacteroidota bacterium]